MDSPAAFLPLNPETLLVPFTSFCLPSSPDAGDEFQSRRGLRCGMICGADGVEHTRGLSPGLAEDRVPMFLRDSSRFLSSSCHFFFVIRFRRCSHAQEG